MQIGVESAKAVDQRRVFVVDEDEITRTALQFMLHDEIETHELASLEEAYAKGAAWLKPDIVMLGAAFVARLGPDVVHEIKAKFAPVSIVIVCEKAEEPVAIEALKAGAHAALVKPLTLDAVRKKIDTILGRGGAAPLIQIGGL
jgi:DNA-binding response OmpR family regulator